MTPSRREFLKGCGALIVSFSAAPFTQSPANAQGPFATHPGHIDPDKLDSWLAIGADGIITAYTGKCDFGQGIFTAQTQLIAEELCVPITRVKLVECDTAITPDQGTTSGSQTTPTNFNNENLSLAAATAREALMNLAAKELGEPVERLKLDNGAITNRSGRQVTYAELVGSKHFNLLLNPTAKRRPAAEWTVLGKPIPSLDRVALMTGQFEFVHYVRVPGMLHGRVVRPPYAGVDAGAFVGTSLIAIDDASVNDIPEADRSKISESKSGTKE